MRVLWWAVWVGVLLGGCVEKRVESHAAPAPRDADLRIAGSDTMLPLVRKWAVAYMRAHPGTVVDAAGGGSKTGIDLLIAGRVDLCAASRPLTPDEVERLHNRRRSLGMATLTAKDALTIYLHPDNPVDSLTLEQLREIFTGTVTNWSQVGGDDLPIAVVSRGHNSGTRLFLREHILDGRPYLSHVQTMPTTEAVVDAVARDKAAVGYGGLVYVAGVKAAAVEGVRPDAESVGKDRYPLTRYLYLYSVSPVEGARRAFLRWVVADAGQTIVKEAGYMPLWQE